MPRALPDDQFRHELNLLHGHGRLLDALYQGADGTLADLLEGLAYGRQERRLQRVALDVSEGNQSYIVGDGKPVRSDGAHKVVGDMVVCDDYGSGRVFSDDQVLQQTVFISTDMTLIVETDLTAQRLGYQFGNSSDIVSLTDKGPQPAEIVRQSIEDMNGVEVPGKTFDRNGIDIPFAAETQKAIFFVTEMQEMGRGLDTRR